MTMKKPKKGTIDWHQHRVCVDSIRNPLKGIILGGPTYGEAAQILKERFEYTDSEIKKLTGSKKNEKA